MLRYCFILHKFYFNNKSQSTAVARSKHEHQLTDTPFSHLLFYLSTLLTTNSYFRGFHPPHFSEEKNYHFTEDPVRVGSALRRVESPSSGECSWYARRVFQSSFVYIRADHNSVAELKQWYPVPTPSI